MSEKKLCAIYNCWDGVELLGGSINCIYEHVHVIIIVWQKESNYGDTSYNPHEELKTLWRYLDYLKQINRSGPIVLFKNFKPTEGGGLKNETEKRNIGIQLALDMRCTHFFHADCDEYYKDFRRLKDAYFRKEEVKPTTDGSVLKMLTYFKRPTLSLEKADNYFVPFIHKLNPDTTAGIQNKYPHYVDPTRRINASDVFEIPGYMHHYSWVRKDIERKVRNSSAKANIERSQLLQDYHNPELGPGYFLKDYGQKLIEVPNYFNIEI